MTVSPPLLENLRVLELATVLAGPAVGQMCAELGASVIKVEPPGGDVTRGWISEGETSSSYFSCVNWGKQSIAIDLNRQEGRHLVEQLTARSDVVISSYRPGSRLARWTRDVVDRHPHLIHVVARAYPEGEDRPGYDAILQAESGFMALNAEPEGRPLKMPVALIDLLLAHQLKEGLLAALLRRERTGQGGTVTGDLFSTAVSSLANQAALSLWSGLSPRPLGTEHPSIVPYGLTLATTNGSQILLGVGNDLQFQGLCESLGTRWHDEPRFATNADRVRHRSELRELLLEAGSRQRADEWLTELARRGVPAGRVRDADEAVADPRLDRWRLGTPGCSGGLRTVTTTLSDDVLVDLSAPPDRSAHAASILRGLLGCSQDDVTRLTADGIVETPQQQED